VDNEPYQSIYDPINPIKLENLQPGTHTLRVFAVRPWHESFKNEEAYAQTTFHIFTKTGDNLPDPHLPLLTYSSPQGSYGAEPIMIDFYLTNAPLHLVAQENPEISDWRIRATINGESFLLDNWQTVYLKGFEKGENWIKLEFLDGGGNLLKNAFNSTVRVINYQPQGGDSLSQLMRGELSLERAKAAVIPNYQAPPAVETIPTPEPAPAVAGESQPEETRETPGVEPLLGGELPQTTENSAQESQGQGETTDNSLSKPEAETSSSEVIVVPPDESQPALEPEEATTPEPAVETSEDISLETAESLGDIFEDEGTSLDSGIVSVPETPVKSQPKWLKNFWHRFQN
jgi:hypothetical protein